MTTMSWLSLSVFHLCGLVHQDILKQVDRTAFWVASFIVSPLSRCVTAALVCSQKIDGLFNFSPLHVSDPHNRCRLSPSSTSTKWTRLTLRLGFHHPTPVSSIASSLNDTFPFCFHLVPVSHASSSPLHSSFIPVLSLLSVSSLLLR